MGVIGKCDVCQAKGIMNVVNGIYVCEKCVVSCTGENLHYACGCGGECYYNCKTGRYECNNCGYVSVD